MDVLELVTRAGLMVRLVLWCLLICSILSWSVMFYKQYSLRGAARESAAFIQAFESGMSRPQLTKLAKTLPASPLAGIFLHVAGLSPDLPPERLRSALALATTRQIQRLHAHLIILATIGSSAPFIGLFGTVWGIVNAFQRIGETGSASLAVVAPGIAEALVTTAAGLAAAIPAVVGYNHQTHQASRLAEEMEPIAAEFIDTAALESA